MSNPTFQHGGRTYEISAWSVIDGVGTANIREVPPPSPFDGAGKTYGPDIDGDSLLVSVPFDRVESKTKLKFHTLKRGEFSGSAYVDPLALAVDLAAHIKAKGLA